MRLFTLSTLLVSLSLLQSGCQMGHLGNGRFARLMPTTGGYDDGTDDSSDPWIAAAADEGRVDHERQREPDPLGLKGFFMSQKARDIERNVGIE